MSTVTSSPTRVADVARQVERLEEHLGDDHRRAEVDEDAAVQVLARRRRGGGSRRRLAAPMAAPSARRVHVDDVGADGDVHGDRHAEARAGGEDAERAVRQPGVEDGLADRGAEPARRRGARDGLVEEAPGLLGHAEAAGGQRGGDILRGRAVIGELEVVDDAGAVHRHGREDAAAHEVDDQRAEADLDRMRAHAQHDRRAGAVARGDGAAPRRADRGRRGCRAGASRKSADPHARRRRRAERGGGDLAAAAAPAGRCGRGARSIGAAERGARRARHRAFAARGVARRCVAPAAPARPARR